MSGKRLIDAARLAGIGRNVVKNHFKIRQEQWQLLTKTSSVARAVKNQTDRVTVTAAAAFELAKRVNETGPQWREEGAEYMRQQGRAAAKEADNLRKDAATMAKDAGFEQTAETLRSAGSQQAQKQDQRQGDDGTLASLRKRELQRQAEAQIPAQAADTQTAGSGHDTFNERSKHVSPELSSSLPRTTLPKHAEKAPDAGEVLQDKKLNQETYPVPGEGDEQLPEGVNINAFHSPRVSRMVGATGPQTQNPFAARKKLPPKPLKEMEDASKRWEEERRAKAQQGVKATEVDEQATEAPQPSASAITASKTTDEPLRSNSTDSETQDLAAEIAQAQNVVAEEQPASKPYEMHESRVPATRFGRIWQYGGLATSMAFGAVGESFRRMTGGTGTGSLMLSEGNMNRLVAKLSRMRGAALKLGQMMSFQDSKILPPTINAVLQRVQDSADYMPSSQRDKVLSRSLGSEWRELFSNFEDKPFAAASIGQVHKATLKSNDKDVAVKVQYPGVRNSIDSDLNNLSLLLTASQLLPKGLFLDKTIANARTELGWECDYEREAAACKKFKNELLIDEQDKFLVPEIYDEACGADVLTAEFMHGTAVTKIHDLSQQERDWIGTNILRLCLRELMEFKYMQTDPNWTNFLYNRNTNKLELLDFGASRAFPDKFVEPYVELLIAASRNDREACRDLSIQLGYLTGHESPGMLKAHVDSILTLAEPFVESAPEVYDFEGQTVTDRVRNNIGLMLRERLAPPPEETYSLHRKLSGAFLLCARLRSKVRARDMFAHASDVWRGRAETVKMD
ncbi:Protein ABC1-like, mitochondrial [Pseudocercospora fuligena]|uniref:Protein ABC1-like, mitochondrial n=1 Tax=Pseudocercospora fuligena TaxID=685502 RepID=A0A8H6VFS4_9PEZI|nr:Protein ABC1-like, mitochondrial [Pseudocercospora fuligena]